MGLPFLGLYQSVRNKENSEYPFRLTGHVSQYPTSWEYAVRCLHRAVMFPACVSYTREKPTIQYTCNCIGIGPNSQPQPTPPNGCQVQRSMSAPNMLNHTFPSCTSVHSLPVADHASMSRDTAHFRRPYVRAGFMARRYFRCKYTEVLSGSVV